MGQQHMLPETVGLVYWKMITYCVPNDKSAQWHVSLLSSSGPSLIVSVISFLYPAPALICWNDSPPIRGTNRMPSASLSLSSLYPHNPHNQTPQYLLNGELNRASGKRGCECSLRSGFCFSSLIKWHHNSKESTTHVHKHLASTSQYSCWSFLS